MRVNLRGRPDVEVTLRGQRLAAYAELGEDPDTGAQGYGAGMAELGQAKAGRRTGIRIKVDRMPTHAEQVGAAHGDRRPASDLRLNGAWTAPGGPGL